MKVRSGPLAQMPNRRTFSRVTSVLAGPRTMTTTSWSSPVTGAPASVSIAPNSTTSVP